MLNETVNIEKVQAVPEDSTKVERRLVEFQRTWVFWENYLIDMSRMAEHKGNDWADQIKRVCSFSDLLTFWQFWNNYPGSHPKNLFFDGNRFMLFFDSKKRIDGLNLFTENISPKWEDSQNDGGRILQLQYEIKDLSNVGTETETFLNHMENYWLKLVLYLIGESIPCAHLVS